MQLLPDPAPPARRVNGSALTPAGRAAGRRKAEEPTPIRLDRRQGREAPAGGMALTARQLECLRWAGDGKSSVDIGAILGISPATVDGHIADACRRLGVRTRIQAIVEAYRRGWID